MSHETFKFLSIADATPEARLAAYFCARRAKHTGARVTLLHVIEPVAFHHWLGVGAEMAREERNVAESIIQELAADVNAETGAMPEVIIREGELRSVLRDTVENDPDVRILVIGASHGGNPGPLVASLARGGRGLFGKRAVPVVVIPSALTREEIRTLA